MFGAGGGAAVAVKWPEDKAAEYCEALMLSNKLHREKVAAEGQLALPPPSLEQPSAESEGGSGKVRDRSSTPPPRRHADPELVAASRGKLGLEG